MISSVLAASIILNRPQANDLTRAWTALHQKQTTNSARIQLWQDFANALAKRFDKPISEKIGKRELRGTLISMFGKEYRLTKKVRAEFTPEASQRVITDRIGEFILNRVRRADVSGSKLKGDCVCYGFTFVHRGRKTIGSVLLLANSSSIDSADDLSSTALVFFDQRNRSVRAHVLGAEEDWGGSLVNPCSAILTKYQLILEGQTQWTGNGPRAAVEVYSLNGAKHRKTAARHADAQSYPFDDLRLRTDGTVAPIDVLCTAYPDHLEACHAMAQIDVRERWILSHGKFVGLYRKRRNTAYSALDDLFGRLQSGAYEQVRRLCVNRTISRRVWDQRGRLLKDRNPMSADDNCSTEMTRIRFDDSHVLFKMTKKHGKWVVGRLDHI